MSLPDEFIRMARAHAHRRKLKYKRGSYVGPGWRKLGSGWFGEAWEHVLYPGLVVKVSGRAGFGRGKTGSERTTPNYDSWQVYAQYCHKHPHEHLPNILHFERINAAVAWAIMPKYTPFDRDLDEERTQLKWARWLNGAHGAPEWMWPIEGMAASLRMTVDLHSGNIMVRDDGILVMTDPFSALET